jgi:hypothetical protein
MTQGAKRTTHEVTKLRLPISFNDAMRTIVHVKPKPKSSDKEPSEDPTRST